MTWYYEGTEFTPDQIGEHRAFVYLIQNQVTNRIYIGKKRFHFTRSRLPKNKKRRVYKVKISDWENYYGSSKELLADIPKHGKDKFTRIIIRLCKSYAESSYYELKEQLKYDVLLYPEYYYNNYVGARIHRKHVLRREK
jgi:hypothetical protein